MGEANVKKLYEGLSVVTEILIPLTKEITIPIENTSIVHFLSEDGTFMNWAYETHDVRLIDGAPWLVLKNPKPKAWR